MSFERLQFAIKLGTVHITAPVRRHGRDTARGINYAPKTPRMAATIVEQLLDFSNTVLNLSDSKISLVMLVMAFIVTSRSKRDILKSIQSLVVALNRAGKLLESLAVHT